MIATCKKLVTDIQRDKDLDKKLPEYAELLGRQYNCYATVKGSMNYYTMKEVCDEQDDKNTDVCKYFALLTGLLDRHLVKREAVDEDSMEAIAQLHMNLVGPNSARKITDRILDSLSRLERFPLSGSLPRDAELLKSGYRYVIAGQYLCVYRLIVDTVFVYHIVHGASNYPVLFKRLLQEELKRED